MDLQIIGVDDLGRGLGKVDGKVCFVNKALAGEQVYIKKVFDGKRYMEGKVEKVLLKSKERKESFCPYSASCDGCSFDITSYENMIKIKKDAIYNLFWRDNIKLDDFDIVFNKKDVGYRNKISLRVVDRKFGYYEENSHLLVPIINCALVKEKINAVLNDFSLYGFDNGSLTIRCNDNDELLLVIDSKDNIEFKDELFLKHKIVGIMVNDKVVYGDGFFYERRNGFLFRVSYDAFFQVNALVSEKIVLDVLSYVNSDDVILDLYCGVGYFSLILARFCQKVIGIEIVLNAVLDANINKKLNNIFNAMFLLGNVSDRLKVVDEDFTKVFIDPPRSGLDKKTLDFLLLKEIPTIIYVSCNPISLKRDLRKLLSKYDILMLKGYDMFSYTKHIECLCVLSLKKSL